MTESALGFINRCPHVQIGQGKKMILFKLFQSYNFERIQALAADTIMIQLLKDSSELEDFIDLELVELLWRDYVLR